jgi:hypothetical protein
MKPCAACGVLLSHEEAPFMARDPNATAIEPTETTDISPDELRKDVWSTTGHSEELAMREAKMGSEGEVDDKSDLVAAETPETTRRISDPHITTKSER